MWRMVLAAVLVALVQDVDREVQTVAMEGWVAARALAPRGGALELLGPVNQRLKTLDSLPGSAARYADVAIRAAVSAAQDERGELDVFLAHARDLSDLMAIGGRPAQWPLPIDELEGELWLEVDRYAESREAFRRAIKVKPTANALIGLARSSDRLGDVAGACAAYAQASSTAGMPQAVELEIALYNLKCRL